jgi:predicted metal-dependent peptidase
MSPKIDWREQLRDFMTTLATSKGDESTWARPNRRWLQAGMYMPSTISKSMGAITVAVDTSGSIDNAALSKALSELVGICDNVLPER